MVLFMVWWEISLFLEYCFCKAVVFLVSSSLGFCDCRVCGFLYLGYLLHHDLLSCARE